MFGGRSLSPLPLAGEENDEAAPRAGEEFPGGRRHEFRSTTAGMTRRDGGRYNGDFGPAETAEGGRSERAGP